MPNWFWGTAKGITKYNTMIVGKGSFSCKDCGCEFTVELAEYNATIRCIPIAPCPKCKSWNMEPIGLTRLNLYLIIPNKNK